MGFKIIIADDQEEVLNSTVRIIKRILEDNKIDAEITLEAQDPSDVLNYSKVNYEDINVYILDINYMKDQNGFSIAKAIRDREPHAYIIFLTAYVQLSMLSFRYRLKLFDFLVKPVSYTELEVCIKDIKEDMEKIYESNNSEHKYIKLTSGYQEHNVNINDIIYIESFGPKLIFHMTNGNIQTYGTLKDIEILLNKLSNNFKRSHKSYIVNLSHIEFIDMENNEIIMSNGGKCFISRSKKPLYRDYVKN